MYLDATPALALRPWLLNNGKQQQKTKFPDSRLLKRIVRIQMRNNKAFAGKQVSGVTSKIGDTCFGTQNARRHLNAKMKHQHVWQYRTLKWFLCVLRVYVSLCSSSENFKSDWSKFCNFSTTHSAFAKRRNYRNVLEVYQLGVISPRWPKIP